MELFLEEAFRELFPRKELLHFEIRYVKRMAPYNSYLSYNPHKMILKMSCEWKEIDDSIKKGLAQSLLMRVYKTKIDKTNYTDLYDSFMRHLHRGVNKDKNDPLLEESFNRINKTFFYSQIERPNLEWGGYTKRVLGNYNYHTDTIRISKYFIDAPLELLDFIMYHELLHKKIKFKTKRGRSHHHTSHFREKEKEFPGAEDIDQRLHEYLVKKIRSHKKKQREEYKTKITGENKPRKKNKLGNLLDWFRV